MSFEFIKSLHIIFFVTWLSGQYFIFRLFVYHVEAARKNEPARTILTDQYGIMERRLWYYITWPSCILTMILGTWLLVLAPGVLSQPWMYLKLFLVCLLFAYQFYGQAVIVGIRADATRYSSLGLRILNEVPAVLLISIVFLVVMRNSVSWIWGTAGIAGLSLLTGLLIWKLRKRKPAQ